MSPRTMAQRLCLCDSAYRKIRSLVNFVICEAAPPPTGYRHKFEMPRRVSIYNRLLLSGDHCAGTGTVFHQDNPIGTTRRDDGHPLAALVARVVVTGDLAAIR